MISFSAFLLVIVAITSVTWDYRASIKRFFVD
jgi:hypothetical protein